MRFPLKRSALAIVAILMMAGCGDENLTNQDQGIVVYITPYREIIDLGDTLQFRAEVQGTDNHAVIWSVNGVAGGDSVYGEIDATGKYMAPSNEPPDADSVRIDARSVADPLKVGNGWAVLVDPSKIYVDSLGSDTTGTGSLHKPYRTISKAIVRAYSGQMIVVGAGTYDLAAGERFPLEIPPGVTMKGAGMDSTFIIGPGGTDPRFDAILKVGGDLVTVEGFNVKSADNLGVGVWLRPGFLTQLVRIKFTGNYIGIYVDGNSLTGRRPIIDSNQIEFDSIGIVTADTSAPIIRNTSITNCWKYGVEIRDMSRPDLGINDSTGAGHNLIKDCGNVNYQWLIYNGALHNAPIYAIGSEWQVPLPSNNDQFIYDDEESGGLSGAVILE
jgi:hypothetical protein